MGHSQYDLAGRGPPAWNAGVKNEALRRAGIGYCEVVSGQTTPSELKRLIEKLVDQTASGPTAVDQIRPDIVLAAAPTIGK